MAIHLSFEKNKCKGCELCISVCPKDILALSDTPNVKGYRPATCLDETQCIGCTSCARMCPDSIITIIKD